MTDTATLIAGGAITVVSGFVGWGSAIIAGRNTRQTHLYELRVEAYAEMQKQDWSIFTKAIEVTQGLRELKIEDWNEFYQAYFRALLLSDTQTRYHLARYSVGVKHEVYSIIGKSPDPDDEPIPLTEARAQFQNAVSLVLGIEKPRHAGIRRLQWWR